MNKKKLIEVALPLDAINAASAREKSIRHGHPSTLHLWWARRPLAAARAVLFAQMVDDPSSYPDLFPTEKQQEKERRRLFKIIEDLVQWENTTNETVLQAARDEIWRSWRRACAENADHPRAAELFDRNRLPAFHDPFAGGGALPLEAQRLGLESYASDLNPVAVLINKAMIEIPPRFAGRPPVNPPWRASLLGASGAPASSRPAPPTRDPLGQAPAGASHGAPASSRLPSPTRPSEPRGWYSRNYLPHLDAPGLVQTITFRLADAVPNETILRWKAELALPDEAAAEAPARAALHERLARYEDAGHGACWLRDPRIARIVQDALLHFDGERYRLLAWCVMPNHVHVVVEMLPAATLPHVMHSWKSFTANRANAVLGRRGEFWQREYYDRYIRDEAHLHAAIAYVEENPVKAGLTRTPEEWPFSSAAPAFAARREAREPERRQERRVERRHQERRHPAGSSRLRAAASKDAREGYGGEGASRQDDGAPWGEGRHDGGAPQDGAPWGEGRHDGGAPQHDAPREESRHDGGAPQDGAPWGEGRHDGGAPQHDAPREESRHDGGAPHGAPRGAPGGAPSMFTGARGLAEDVRYYGQWMRDEAERRIGHLYPKIAVTAEMAQERPDLKPYVGRKLTVIAWLWARTVKSPNPAFAAVDVPLASTFMLSTKKGKEAYVEPVIEDGGYRFTVKVGKPKDAEAAKNGTKLARGANFRCLMSATPIASDHIYGEAQAGRMGARLMAIVAEGDRGRVYLAPTPEHEAAAREAKPEWKPEVAMPENPRWFSPPLYGLKTYGDLFTPRQLVALTTFSDLVGEAMQEIRRDALAAGLPDDPTPLRDGGAGATAYAEAVAVYLAFAVDKLADRNSTICAWASLRQHARNTFGRQAIPMVWDFAESNPLSDSSGNFAGGTASIAAALKPMLPLNKGHSLQVDCATQDLTSSKISSTDPPYYDNIGYADLSDFFYVWLRRSLRRVFPDLFATLAVPKAEELVATPYRHGSKEQAERFFLHGMTEAMHRLSEQAHPAFPVTIYYAFKQSETKSDQGTVSTGWETFLDAVISSGFGVSGTWPIRTELGRRLVGQETNALASSLILVCNKRAADLPTATRREFVAALKSELPEALQHLQAANIAPVDLEQAAIGPGMSVYTRHRQVLDAEGKRVSVHDALTLINQVLDETLAEQESDFDADTRFALAWFEQQGFAQGEFGVADVLARAKNTSVQGLVDAGVLVSSRGKVRLLKPSELPADWDPATDTRLTVWECVHHLIRALESGGEAAAAELVAKLGTKAETARELAYRLFTLCERKKRAADALAYNGLVQSFPEITRLARDRGTPGGGQSDLFAESEA